MEEENKKEIDETVTREINLDELYDGAVNNTVIIDPITKNEVLLKPKSSGGKILGIIFLLLVLLLLYFVTNKLSLNNKKANVKPNVTTTTTTTAPIIKKGTLVCTYSSESSSEKQNATYTVNYENDMVIDSEFSYVVNLLAETSEIYNDLQKQYETFFINNASITGVTFTKEEKSFDFNFKVKYNEADFSKYTMTDGQMILYAIPSSSDTLTSVQETYTKKGYSCTNKISNGE